MNGNNIEEQLKAIFDKLQELETLMVYELILKKCEISLEECEWRWKNYVVISGKSKRH
jgi:hypothetical protein